jgi:hypothetical protein
MDTEADSGVLGDYPTAIPARPERSASEHHHRMRRRLFMGIEAPAGLATRLLIAVQL